MLPMGRCKMKCMVGVNPTVTRSRAMKNLAATILVLSIVLVCGSRQAWAGSFDFGVGLGFADSAESDDFAGGWNVIAGYEQNYADGWNFGAQMHFIKGWTDKGSVEGDTSMYYRSTALYATARPDNGWLQFSGGVVAADYKSLTMEDSGAGFAAGAGIVLGNENFRLHLLDIHRYMIEGQGFNIYSLSMIFLY
jgi:hypothetical protein